MPEFKEWCFAASMHLQETKEGVITCKTHERTGAEPWWWLSPVGYIINPWRMQTTSSKIQVILCGESDSISTWSLHAFCLLDFVTGMHDNGCNTMRPIKSTCSLCWRGLKLQRDWKWDLGAGQTVRRQQARILLQIQDSLNVSWRSSSRISWKAASYWGRRRRQTWALSRCCVWAPRLWFLTQQKLPPMMMLQTQAPAGPP
jgi:hypothetical protein